jgi:hypothetical protein
MDGASAVPDEVVWAVTQLRELLDLYTSRTQPVSPGEAYQFLALAEGAIHAIARSAQSTAPPPGTPIAAKWEGTYNNDYSIELVIDGWRGAEFTATMSYPESQTRTKAAGRIEAAADTGRVDIVWTEVGYTNKGRRSIDFNGEFRAVIVGQTMDGAWYARPGGRRVAGFHLVASPAVEQPVSRGTG